MWLISKVFNNVIAITGFAISLLPETNSNEQFNVKSTKSKVIEQHIS